MTLAETPVSIAALETTSTVVSAIHANNGGNAVAGRKRSLSMSIEQASNINKSMKTGLSPIPCHPRTSSAITLQNIASRNNNRNNNVPTFNLQVLAATILFTAFQFVDHWPVPLIKAYAEDCFGPRLWVDHKQCALLVANLSLVHDGNDEGATAATGESSLSSSSISDLETDAAKVAETYKAFCVFDHAAPSSPSRRRESITDSQGHGRAAARAFQVQQFLSSTSSGSLNETTKKKGVPQLWGQKISNPQHGMDSDSGDEDENVINERSVNDISNPYLRNKDDTNMGGGSFSPSHLSDSDDNHVDFDQGKERKRRDELNTNDDVGESASYDGSWAGTAGQLRNESVPSETASADSNHGYSTSALGSMNGSNIEALYPILQRRLRLERVRRRFFGANLESAHDAITSSFSDRLDVKSKQNSSLLHCLPSFTSIPGVRGLIAANLEKWLQSPALAGLARTLFSSTVNYMKNVDPPLPDDLRAIDSIIGMRLKANQVINAAIARLLVYVRFV